MRASSAAARQPARLGADVGATRDVSFGGALVEAAAAVRARHQVFFVFRVDRLSCPPRAQTGAESLGVLLPLRNGALCRNVPRGGRATKPKAMPRIGPISGEMSIDATTETDEFTAMPVPAMSAAWGRGGSISAVEIQQGQPR